jgi:hypothetical protein
MAAVILLPICNKAPVLRTAGLLIAMFIGNVNLRGLGETILF